MSKFSIKTKISNRLRGQNGKVLVDLKWLGTGGAFDFEEKNSSLLIKTKEGKVILIDCGSTVYEQLRKEELVEDIDYVFLTHMHDDHFGSLSTLIYDRFFIHKKKTIIVCFEKLTEELNHYLIDVCGNSEEQFEIINNSLNVTSSGFESSIIDTTGYHKKGMPTAGFVFTFDVNGEKIYILYSGDINVPFVSIIKNELREKMFQNVNNIFIFQDVTFFEYPNQAHCNYKKLEPILDSFKNTFIYHHSKQEAQSILQQNPYFKSMSLIEKDLIIIEDFGI